MTLRENGWKMLSSVLATVGLIAGGVWAVETRYAKTADFALHLVEHKAETRAITAEVLRNRLDVVAQNLFELERVRQQRPLTPIERQRLDELRLQVETLRERIRVLERAR